MSYVADLPTLALAHGHATAPGRPAARLPPPAAAAAAAAELPFQVRRLLMMMMMMMMMMMTHACAMDDG